MTISATSQGLKPGVVTSSNRPANPYDGMVIYETDTDKAMVWNGSSWVNLSTGTASAPSTAVPGLEYIGTFTADGTDTSLWCDNIFSATYDNYRVAVRMNSTVQGNPCFYRYLDVNGSQIVTNYYGAAYMQDFTTGQTAFQSCLTANNVQYIGYLPNSNGGSSMLVASMDIYMPFISTIATAVVGTHSGINSGAWFAGGHILGQSNSAVRARGLRFGNGGAGNLTGSVTVYGYRL
jgi:hypothetical protein